MKLRTENQFSCYPYVRRQAGTTGWLPAQIHAGENIGSTDTHFIFVELKD